MSIKRKTIAFIKHGSILASLLCCSFISGNVFALELNNGVNASSAQPEQRADGLIVKYRTNSNFVTQAQRGVQLNRLSQTVGRTLRIERQLSSNAQLLQVENATNLAELQAVADQLALDPNVEYAEPNLILHIMAVPNDPRYNEQWHYYEATGGMNLPAAWDVTTGSGVVVAVLDTGYRPHADLAANIVSSGYDMISSSTNGDGNGRDNDAIDPGDGTCTGQSSSWHGTHVAGTIAAVTNNGVGVAGVAYDAQILPVRVLGCGGGTIADIADAIRWAAGLNVAGVPQNTTPAQVVNLSLGGGGSCGNTMQNAINAAVNAGTTVVVAAGNSNTNASNATPANCNNVITVAATNRAGSRSYYSNFGNVVEVAAPGGETIVTSNGVLSTLDSGFSAPQGDTYAFYQGTSMATPHVAGLAALLYSIDSTFTPAQISDFITSTARTFPGTCNQCGSGIADASAAVAAASGNNPPPPPPPPPPAGNVLENGVPVTGLSASTGVELRYTLDVPGGATNLVFQTLGSNGDADLYVRFGAEPTTSVYDGRGFTSSSNETVTINNVQAGTYYVMVRAYRSFSNLSLQGSFTDSGTPPPGGGGTFENTNNVNIFDFTTVTSPISVPSGITAGDVVISVDIKHTYVSDLTIDLIRPDGQTFRLRNRSGGSSNDILESYTLSFGGIDAQGTWQLSVHDYAGADQGFIDSWSITF